MALAGGAEEGKDTIVRSNGLDTDFTQGITTYVPAFELIEKKIKWNADILNKMLKLKKARK